jgi:hypothetical protein
MSTPYIDAAMRHAQFVERRGGTYYAEIAGFPGDGVWAIGATRAACVDALHLALESTVTVALRKGQGRRSPLFNGISALD